MPSNDTKTKQSIRRRPHVGRKIKFYETKDEEDDAKLNPPMELERETRRNLSKSATLPNRKKSSDVRPSVIDVTSKLKVRSARNRDNIAKADEGAREQPKEYLDTNIRLDENDNVAFKSRRSTSRERRSKERTRGLNDNSSTDTQKLPTSALDASKDDSTLQQGLQAEEQAIPFLSTRDIGRIYQSQPEHRQVNREYDSLSPDPDEYHWKIVESRKNLQELQKSLSNDFSGEDVQSVTNNHQPNSVDTTPEVLRAPAHLRLSKQESNTSVSSNISTSSTISKKLLSLSETTKSEKLPRRRSQKSKSKDSSWTQENLSSRERSGSQTYRVTATSRQQRKTISGIQYNEDDVKSPTNPPTETPASNAKEKDADTHPVSDDTFRAEAAEQGAFGTFTSALSPDIDTKDEPSNDFFNKHSSNSSELHMDDQIDGGGVGERDHKNLSSSVRVRSRETKIVPDKETPKPRSYSAKFNSMPRMTSKYIFKVDLDQQQDSQYSSRTYRYRSRRSTRQDVEPNLEVQSKRRENETNTDMSKSEQVKREDKDNQPKKTPSSIQPEPVSTHSKRLQVRPWNMLGHLSNNVTQTTRTATRDTLSQTKKPYYESTSTQTGEKTYKTIGIQTDALVTKQEFAAQINPSVKTVEVQTDELNEGATISLDNLIRMGAIKRTKSLGLGLSSPNLERPIVRSSSSNYTTTLRKEATEVNSNKTVTVASDGTETSGKIASYNWNENKKFVKIFVSYSGIHLLPSKNIQVKTNGINMLLTVEECVSRTKDGEELRTLTSTLYLNRLRRPVSCLSYNVQRDMVTIMLRKQKQTPWNALLFSGVNV